MSNYLSLCFVFVFDIQGHLWFSTTNISYIYIYIYHTNIDSLLHTPFIWFWVYIYIRIKQCVKECDNLFFSEQG